MAVTTSSVRRFWNLAARRLIAGDRIAVAAAGCGNPTCGDAFVGQRLANSSRTIGTKLGVGGIIAARIGIADKAYRCLWIGAQDLRQRRERRAVIGAELRGRGIEVELVERERARRRSIAGEERLQVVIQRLRLQIDRPTTWQRHVLDGDRRRAHACGYRRRGHNRVGVTVAAA